MRIAGRPSTPEQGLEFWTHQPHSILAQALTPKISSAPKSRFQLLAFARCAAPSPRHTHRHRSAAVLGDTSKPRCNLKAQAGHLTLGLGDDAGTTIVDETQAGDTRPLARALAQARREMDAPPTRVARLEHDAERASGAMRKVQEVLEHLTDIAEGHIDAETLGGWADELIDRLKGLDPDEHWQERLRVLRTLVVLLALLERWLELAQSLSDALRAAEQLGDEGARAWVMHELGTLHLAAGQHAKADD